MTVTAPQQTTTFYAVIGDGPDGFGRHHFTLHWWGYHPFTGWSVRGQTFHGIVEAHRERLEAGGGVFRTVETAEEARALAAEEGAR